MKAFFIALTIIVTSLFYFPIQFPWFLPGINTKLMLAAVGALIFIVDLSRYGQSLFDKNFFNLIVFSSIVSFWGLFSVVYNNTYDLSYAGYLFSMLVWFAAAYVVAKIIHTVHGSIDVRLVANYLIAVCVLQCVAAIMNDNIPAFKQMVDTYVSQGQDFINDLTGVKRKYGIGANLDTAGIRFSVVLCMIPIVMTQLTDYLKRRWLWLYILSFLFISIEGNVIARTTIIGMGMGLLYFLFHIKLYKTQSPAYNRWMTVTFVLIVSITTLFTVVMFNTNEAFEKDLRFGFEGLFSLWETGEWHVTSNERLKNMYVWPDNPKTWIIGDGYFSNPINTDPYFTGEITGGYYKGTDVGFLRFIYYFGGLGLLAFAVFFMRCGKICGKVLSPLQTDDVDACSVKLFGMV